MALKYVFFYGFAVIRGRRKFFVLLLVALERLEVDCWVILEFLVLKRVKDLF